MAGAADGDYDRRTEIAVKLFEQACGQLPSGTLSSDHALPPEFRQRARLRSSSAIRYAELCWTALSGDAVRLLQSRLVELGFATGSPTGEYGEATTSSRAHFPALQRTGRNRRGGQLHASGTVFRIRAEHRRRNRRDPHPPQSPPPRPQWNLKLHPPPMLPELITTGASGDDVLQSSKPPD